MAIRILWTNSTHGFGLSFQSHEQSLMVQDGVQDGVQEGSMLLNAETKNTL